MTLQKIAVKQFGKRGYGKLPLRLKKLLKDIDGLAINKKPWTRRQIERLLA